MPPKLSNFDELTSVEEHGAVGSGIWKSGMLADRVSLFRSMFEIFQIFLVGATRNDECFK